MAKQVRLVSGKLPFVVLLNALISLSKLPIDNRKCEDQCISMCINRYYEHTKYLLIGCR